MAAARRSSFKVVPHTAEVAVELRAATWAGFFGAAARGLGALYGLRRGAAGKGIRRVRLRADSAEELLVSWLNELVFIIGTRRRLPAKIRFARAGPFGLDAELALCRGFAAPEREIKAATFGALKVRKGRAGLRASVILDV